MNLLKKLFGSVNHATQTSVRPAAAPRRSFRPEMEKLEDREVPTLMWPTVYTLWGATSFVSSTTIVR
jgi:hypothetical protein